MKLLNLPFNLPFGRARSGASGIPETAVDLGTLNRTIMNALQAAGLKTGLGEKKASEPIPSMRGFAEIYRAGVARMQDQEMVDVVARESFRPERTAPAGIDAGADADSPKPCGAVVSASHTGRAGTRSYKLYVPALLAKEPMPLVVMLHGCTQ